MREIAETLELLADKQSRIDHLKSRPENQDERSAAILKWIGYNIDDEAEKLIPWIFRELKKGRIQNDVDRGQLYVTCLPSQFGYRTRGGLAWWQAFFRHMADWAAEKRPNLMSLQIHDVAEQMTEWDVELQSQMDGDLQYEKQDIVHTFDNGWTVQTVTTSADLKTEGELMGHCVGGYCEDVHSGNSYIYSIRDPKNRPHVTIETSQPVTPEQYTVVVQIQGKGNEEPISEYQELVKQWFENYPVRYRSTRTILAHEVLDGVTIERDHYGVLTRLPPDWALILDTLYGYEERGILRSDPTSVAHTLVTIAIESDEEELLREAASYRDTLPEEDPEAALYNAPSYHPLSTSAKIVSEVLALLQKFSRPSEQAVA